MIHLKSKAEIELIRKSGRIVYDILQNLKEKINPGVTTMELDQLACEIIIKHDGKPAPPEVGFPGNICVSVNEEVVHGVPGDRKLKSGDIVSIDITASFNGYYGDMAATFPVGEITDEAKSLMEITEDSLYAGIAEAVDGNRLGDVSHAVQKYVEDHGYSVVRDFVGHGIGKNMWEEPQIPNFGVPNRGVRLKKGMVLAIEPMVNMGKYEVDIMDDGWTAVTRDKSLSAHFEHTVAILDEGPDVLTKL
ncbi:type I methionyl aminopeptidase [Candidatus Poribacteria bacterium]|nr:type I methionyl aminopeptidase [Candidatus Poribacteria bacterium]